MEKIGKKNSALHRNRDITLVFSAPSALEALCDKALYKLTFKLALTSDGVTMVFLSNHILLYSMYTSYTCGIVRKFKE